MEKYDFHSTLPPEELKKEVDHWVRVEDILLDKHGKMKIKWRGMRFLMIRRDYTSTDFSGISARPFSVSASIGKSYEVWFENFWGRIVPDGAGGSILEGWFVMPLWGVLMFAVMGVVTVRLLFAELYHYHTLECVINWGVFAAILIHIAIQIRNSPPKQMQTELFLNRKFEESEA